MALSTSTPSHGHQLHKSIAAIPHKSLAKLKNKDDAWKHRAWGKKFFWLTVQSELSLQCPAWCKQQPTTLAASSVLCVFVCAFSNLMEVLGMLNGQFRIFKIDSSEGKQL